MLVRIFSALLAVNLVLWAASAAQTGEHGLHAAWPSPAPLRIAEAGDEPAERRAFEAAKELGTVEAWDAFLSNYPKGFYADLARADLKKISGDGAPSSDKQERRVSFSCSEGIPLIVTFVDEGNDSYALYSHDSGPTIRLPAAVSGSGFRYSDSDHELRGKGSDIDLSEGGNVIDSCSAD